VIGDKLPDRAELVCFCFRKGAYLYVLGTGLGCNIYVEMGVPGTVDDVRVQTCTQSTCMLWAFWEFSCAFCEFLRNNRLGMLIDRCFGDKVRREKLELGLWYGELWHTATKYLAE